MKKSHAASVLVAVSATVMWMGTAAFAATGFAGHPLTAAGAAAHSVRALTTSATRCDGDHDSDDVGCGTANACDGDHDSDDVGCGTKSVSGKGDGDHDSDDVTPSRHCGTDRDRDDRTGRPSDHDGDVCGRG